MQKTPLNSWHVTNGATMTDFNGWEMPLYYRGITEEHLHTRSAAGIFDLCHMGRFIVRGRAAREFVDSLTPAHVPQAKTGDVQYSFLLDEQGKTIDDITIYYAEDFVMLVVNSGGRDQDFAWVSRQAAGRSDVTVEDYSERWAMIAVQGPRTDAIMSAAFGEAFRPLPYYSLQLWRAASEAELAALRWQPVELCGESLDNCCVISATGYTGEGGYEIYFPAAAAEMVWAQLLNAGQAEELWPIGLGARDSLRLEAAMPLYGHELNEMTTPLEAGLGKFVDLNKPHFMGRQALLEQKAAGGPERKLVGFELLKRGPVARHGHELFSSDGRMVGLVTSGIFSPTLQKVIGLGYVEAALAAVGNEILVDIRGRKHPAVIVKRPFYKRSN